MINLPKAPIQRIIKESGAIRSSDDACTTLADILSEVGLEISERAVQFAKHAGRKTVKAEDIILAAKE